MIDFKYIEETRLIENLNQLEFGQLKYAGILDDLGISGVAGTVTSFAKDFIDDKRLQAEKEGVGSVVLSMLAPGILFKIHPLLGIFYTIADSLGFSIGNVINSVKDGISSKLESGEQVTASEINSIGKSAVAAEAGAPEKEAGLQIDWLVKEAQWWSSDSKSNYRSDIPTRGQKLPNIPFFGGGGSVVSRIFGQLLSQPRGATRGKWLIGGIIIWVIKTVLLSAGLLAGGKIVNDLVGKIPAAAEFGKKYEDKLKEEESSNKKQEETEEISIKPMSTEVRKHQSVAKKIWYVPIDKTLADTLLVWFYEYYPMTEFFKVLDRDNFIKEIPKFKSIVSELNSNKIQYIRGEKYLAMPDEFTNRKQVVDTFSRDVFQALKTEEQS